METEPAPNSSTTQKAEQIQEKKVIKIIACLFK
jgi:hypothetical protein